MKRDIGGKQNFEVNGEGAMDGMAKVQDVIDWRLDPQTLHV